MFLTLSSALLMFCIFSIALSGAGNRIDIHDHRLKMISGVSGNALEEELEKSLVRRIVIPVYKKTTKLLSHLIKHKKSGKSDNALAHELRLAGIFIEPEEYSFIKLAVIIVYMILLFASIIVVKNTSFKLLILIFGSIIAILFPRYFLKFRISSRQASMRHQLPAVIDILSVSIEAGLSFDAALTHVINAFKGPLIDELSLLAGELQMGRVRREALKALGDRTDIPELKAFTSSIIQSDQLGIPLKNVLRSQAAQLRAERKQRAQEKGMKAPVKMMLPMVVFVFPVIFIILLGPTIIRLMKQFG
ncbi:MAG: type II secretion system F family protein [Bacillota bacterium]|nr:type II secretion system F family protein [Bacillota bacterium]